MGKRRLIIGYRTSSEGADALALGRVLAEATEAVPVVAMVFAWPAEAQGTADLAAALAEDSSPPLAFATEALAGFELETVALADPSASSALTHLAERERASIVVVGSSHRGRIGRTLLGGTAASLAHGAPCALAVAPRGYADREWRGLGDVAVAFDGSPESWSALESAIGLAERVNGRLTVIAVADFPHYGRASAVSTLADGDVRDSEIRDKQRVLDLALARCPSDLEVEPRLLRGDTGTELVDVSREFHLLLAGSRRYGALRRTVLGGATRRLLTEAECPVLVLPRAAALDPLGVRARSDSLGASVART
ncbi:MAG: universal stress protein [Solirubrobacterales bacterium]